MCIVHSGLAQQSGRGARHYVKKKLLVARAVSTEPLPIAPISLSRKFLSVSLRFAVQCRREKVKWPAITPRWTLPCNTSAAPPLMRSPPHRKYLCSAHTRLGTAGSSSSPSGLASNSFRPHHFPRRHASTCCHPGSNRILNTSQ